MELAGTPPSRGDEGTKAPGRELTFLLSPFVKSQGLNWDMCRDCPCSPSTWSLSTPCSGQTLWVCPGTLFHWSRLVLLNFSTRLWEVTASGAERTYEVMFSCYSGITSTRPSTAKGTALVWVCHRCPEPRDRGNMTIEQEASSSSGSLCVPHTD